MAEIGQQELPQSISDLQDRVGPQLDQVRETLEELNVKALRLMREKPGLCLLGAVAAGYLVGRIVSRR
ncbi:MAG: hypothetical protein ACK4N5_21370 [Myxococcales bacterium]